MQEQEEEEAVYRRSQPASKCPGDNELFLDGHPTRFDMFHAIIFHDHR
jgi:hypothetical protein